MSRRRVVLMSLVAAFAPNAAMAQMGGSGSLQGTVFDPANAASLSVGLAHSHTRLRGERHEYWLGNFGTAARTPNHEKLLTAMNPPALETLCPGYKFYAPAGAAALYVRKDQAFLNVRRRHNQRCGGQSQGPADRLYRHNSAA